MKKHGINWFGVRSISVFGKKKDGKNIFEERVVIFSGQNASEALQKALAEDDEYKAFHNTVGHPELLCYEQDGEPLIEGYEVWSALYETDEDLHTFYESRYGKYEYHPDE
jgi:hypothetical protein